jgi:hypothetical protein
MKFYEIMKVLILFCFVFFSPSIIFSSDVTLEAVSKINGNAGANDFCFHAASMPGGGSVAVGLSSDNVSSFAQLFRYDGLGNVIWQRSYAGITNGYDYFYRVITDNAGNIYVAGRTLTLITGNDVLLQKYSPDGTLVWTRTMNSVSGASDTPYDMIRDNDGNLLILFVEDGEMPHINVVKSDPSGNIIWQYRNSDTISRASSIEIDENNNVYVAGNIRISSFGDAGLILKLSSTGTVLWRKIGAPVYNYNFVKSKSRNGVVATGSYYAELNNRFSRIESFDSSGNLLWYKNILMNVSGEILNQSVSIDSSDNVYHFSTVISIVTGSAQYYMPGYLFGKFSSSGDSVWSRFIFHPDVYSFKTLFMKINRRDQIFLLYNNYYTYDVADLVRYNTSGDSIASGVFYVYPTYGHFLNLALTDDGEPMVCGEKYAGFNKNDYITAAYDINCGLKWAKSYDSKGFSYDAGTQVIEDSLGNIFVAGYNSKELYLIKYNSQLNELWRFVQRDTSGSSEESVFPPKIVTDRFGNVYVTGSANNPASGIDIIIRKVAPAGNELFSIFITGYERSYDKLNAITITPEGKLIVSGSMFEGGVQTHFINTYSPEGNLLWTFGPSDDAYSTVLKYKDGHIYTVGGRRINKLTESGDLVWARVYQPNNFVNVLTDLVIDKGNNIAVCGYGVEAGQDENFTVLRYDENGNQLWSYRYNGLRNWDDAASSIALDSLNNIIVAGHSVENTNGYGFQSITLMKLDTSGNLLWKKHISGDQQGNVTEGKVITDEFDNIYVSSGEEYSPRNFGYMLAKYRTNGDSVWRSTYSDPRFSIYSHDFILTRSAGLIMTGRAYGTNTGYDITTLKYSQTVSASEENIVVPERFGLHQNFPNPFNPSTTIGFDLPMKSDVELTVYDALGRKVQTLLHRELSPGYHETLFNAANLSSGIYFFRIIAGNFSETKKMLLLR